MAKRFTDTDKWKDEWWGSLPNDYRMVWLYIVDSCSIAGIWKKDFRGLNFNCNTQIAEEEFLKVFGSRLVDRGNFYFIPKFLRFQCPKGLNSNKPAVISIIKELTLNNLIIIVNESFGNDFLIIKDKDKGKDKGTGKDKDKEKDKGTGQVQGKLEIFESLFSDQKYVTDLQIAHKGKNIEEAFSECYIHHSNAPNPPQELWEWRQKLNTWLSIKKTSSTNGTSKDKRTDNLRDLAEDFNAKYGGGNQQG